ncbi:universal stress protein [Natrinema caseinilyticum]|uniref:universal stress protein n=1 Tax=Natrinema caseinilyticum TaxID=2961570 RepID=UPI0020C2F570|nr:universal stress protein [Natrinema caseinilyticum]
MARTILVPIDGSDQASDALEYAVTEYPADRIVAIHAINLDTASMHGEEGFPYRDEYFDQLREVGRQRLESARETADEHGVDIDTELARGKPARAITDYIDDHDVDHVVIGSHGRSGPTRILLGSVAEAVTRRSPVPVTVVR